MSTVTIIAKVKAKPQSIEYVQHELLKLVAPTRLEAGCIDYITKPLERDLLLGSIKKHLPRSRTA